jgi:hypothetical protein
MNEYEEPTSPFDDLGDKIETEIQGLEMNIRSSLREIKSLLFFIFILGIIALVHFW